MTENVFLSVDHVVQHLQQVDFVPMIIEDSHNANVVFAPKALSDVVHV